MVGVQGMRNLLLSRSIGVIRIRKESLHLRRLISSFCRLLKHNRSKHFKFSWREHLRIYEQVRRFFKSCIHRVSCLLWRLHFDQIEASIYSTMNAHKSTHEKLTYTKRLMNQLTYANNIESYSFIRLDGFSDRRNINRYLE